jgi:hypothetical protein
VKGWESNILKIEESEFELEVLCTDCTALVASMVYYDDANHGYSVKHLTYSCV